MTVTVLKGPNVVPSTTAQARWDKRQADLYEWSNGRFNPDEMAKLRKPEKPAPTDLEGILQTRVSVVCPTTDARHVFHDQLWAVFDAQTWPDKELIVVETYKDKPSPFFSKKAKLDDRIIYVTFQVTKDQDWSIGLKRNMCTHLASGLIIANFDDDDLYAPGYIPTMVADMVKQKSDAITLSTYYIFDASCGKFGWTDQRYASEDVRYGYGFSYVFFRPPALKDQFPNQNMGEDYHFFNRIRKRPHGTILGGGRHVALYVDEYGICCHTLHPNSTSGVYAKRQVPPEEIEGLDIGNLDILQEYVSRFPQTRELSGYIGKIERRSRTVSIQSSVATFDVQCAVGATIAEVQVLAHAHLQCGGTPDQLNLHRTRPPCLRGTVDDGDEDAGECQAPPRRQAEAQQRRPQPRRDNQVLRVLALHGAASNSNLMKFQTTQLRKAIGNNAEWFYPDGIVPWEPCEEKASEASDAKEVGSIDDYYSKRTPFEKRIAQGKPFCSWYALDEEGDVTEESTNAAIDWLMDYIKREGPFDVVVAYQQSCSLAILLSDRYRQAKGAVPWHANVHFSSTMVNGEAKVPPLPTDTVLVVSPSDPHWCRMAKDVYRKVFPSLVVLEHADGFGFPTSQPQAGDINNAIVAHIRRCCSSSTASVDEDAHEAACRAKAAAVEGAPPLSDSEKVGIRDRRFWATIPRERHESPQVEVMVCDVRNPEIAVYVHVHGIDRLGGVRQAVVDRYGTPSTAGLRAGRALRLAEKVKRPGLDEGHMYAACDLSKWLADRREFYAPGLRELLDQSAKDSGLPVEIRAHITGGEQFVYVEVPAFATVADFRAALQDRLPESAVIYGDMEREPLLDTMKVPPVVTIEGADHLVWAGIFSSRSLAMKAQAKLIEALAQPKAQKRLKEHEEEAAGDLRKYKAKMNVALVQEIYTRVLQSYMVPTSWAGVMTLSHSIQAHSGATDWEMALQWHKLETLCRNRPGIDAAERFMASMVGAAQSHAAADGQAAP